MIGLIPSIKQPIISLLSDVEMCGAPCHLNVEDSQVYSWGPGGGDEEADKKSATAIIGTARRFVDQQFPANSTCLVGLGFLPIR